MHFGGISPFFLCTFFVFIFIILQHFFLNVGSYPDVSLGFLQLFYLFLKFHRAQTASVLSSNSLLSITHKLRPAYSLSVLDALLSSNRDTWQWTSFVACGFLRSQSSKTFFSLISFLQFLISCETCRFDSTHILLSSWNHTVTRFVHRYFPWGFQFFCINVWWDWVEVFCCCCFGGLIGQLVSFIFYLFIYFLVSFF